MKNLNDVLIKQLSEQIALVEDLYKSIDGQISSINKAEYADAKSTLTVINQILECHFAQLNQLLEELDEQTKKAHLKLVASNGEVIFDNREKELQISRVLRDNYSALNLITIGNTLLHTTALALNNQALANLTLKHLENLVPLVIKVGELLPYIAVRELQSDAPNIDLEVARAALKNAKSIWQKSS